MSQSNEPRSALIVVVDRLGSGFVGPYGNTWIDTPAMNRLASESILLENLIADSLDLERLYRSWWSGRHAMDRSEVAGEQGLASLANDCGLETKLLTDDCTILEHALAQTFQDRALVDQPAKTEPAGSVEETAIGEVFLAGLDLLAETNSPALLWLHARGMEGVWDAPLALREAFRDEEDPPPYELVEPPRFQLEANHDPDELLSMMHAFAAQVTVVDTCLTMLLDALQQHPRADNTLLVFTSPRGYPLGEHGFVGDSRRALYGESLRTPCLIRRPQSPMPMRLQTLAQPTDLFATLADWWGCASPETRSGAGSLFKQSDSESMPAGDCAFSASAGEQAVTTPAWFLHRDEDGSRELYCKPDDRWEVNEVADRCGDIPQQLSDLIDVFRKSLDFGMPARLPELPKDLLEGTE